MRYSDIRTMPVRYRKWYVKRLVKHFKDQNERLSNNKPANNSSTPAKLSGQDIDNFQDAINRKFS